MEALLNFLIYGLVQSAFLSLVAIGFSLTYGISRLPNFAHGALYILAGFLIWNGLNVWKIGYLPSVVLAIIFTALIGYTLYYGIIIRVRGMEVSEVIATFAFSFVVVELLRYFGLFGLSYTLPPFLRGSLEFAGIVLDYQRLIVIVSTLALVAFLYLFTHYTKTGLAFRAIAQDEQVAMMLGIDSDRVAALSLAFGSALAALAAAIWIPVSQLASESALEILLYALVVSILGGLGSVAGVIVASLIIGYAQVFTASFIAPHYQMIVALVAIIILLLTKPSGIFGKQKELEERV
ncbi:inner-membrane translocator [Ferroglobus placidus DSM 10642]|uniref:Inner-membrane translocator n=1 Tax=Ferroglobus placidus (strain DSM 10642 / AEDII12DO) TaxID=589924 RepID=D3S132_FERPA|nr:branched-chain amino acid ABC transporter permease [Ferroglobus placidus]ADC64268.1 inner-membrane translocator [Ferroglobus placidus DSM 10642]